MTTTNTIEGRQIGQYLRVVASGTVAEINAFKDFSAGFHNFVGVGSMYEGEICKAREDALTEIVYDALELGAGESSVWTSTTRLWTRT